MVKEKEKPHGYIYRATNVDNDKIYIGQTITSRWGENKTPIEERWKGEVQEAIRKNKVGEKLRDIEKAIIEYGSEKFKLQEQDKAYNQEESDSKETHWIKETDSMNPEKGYNMTEGGLGGRPSPEALEQLRERMSSPEYKQKMSQSIKAKYDEDPEYYNKQTKERSERAKNPEFIEKMTKINRERAKDPEFIEKMTKINRERAKDPEWREKMTRINREMTQKPEYRQNMSEIMKEKAKDPTWRENVSKGVSKKYQEDPDYKQRQTQERRERAKNPEWIQKMKDINRDKRKEIKDKREFLNDIKEKVPKKEMLTKYGMGKNTFTKRIQEMFGPDGPKNYTELKDHLQDKNVDDVLKDIDNRSGERQDSSIENKIEENKEEPHEDSKEKEDEDEKQSEEKSKNLNDRESEESVEEKPKEPSEESSEESTEEGMDEGKEETTEPQSEESQGQVSEESTDISDSKEEQLKTSDRKMETKYLPGQGPKKKRDNKDKVHPYIFTSGKEQRQPVQKSFKDYNGIDESPGDKKFDYDGIDTPSEDEKSDIKSLDGGVDEKGNDYDGIDDPQEDVDKDYDKLDESYGEGGSEG